MESFFVFVTRFMIQISQDVIDAVSTGFNVPSKPQLLTDVQRICAQDEPDMGELSDVIAHDIGLSSAILKTINSPSFGMNRAISDIQQAVMLLGFNAVSTLVAGILIKQSFKGEAAISFERLWDNASLVADTMVYIGKNIEHKIPPENLYTTGLFHDCGIAAMSMKYTDYRNTLIEANQREDIRLVELEDQRYASNHAIVGYFITSAWAIPRDICQVVLQHHSRDFLDQKQDSYAKMVYSTLKVADNIVNNLKRRHDTTDWAHIKDKCFEQLGIMEHDYLDLLEDIDEQWNAAF